jgi:hypothetical protein
MNNFWTEITKVSSFKTTEAAKDHVNAIAKRFHFAIRIADSGKQRALTLVCSRSGLMKASGDSPVVDQPTVPAQILDDEQEVNSKNHSKSKLKS